MNELIELLEDLRGDMPKTQFAERLGISYQMLNKMYARERSAGRKVIEGMLAAYPDRADDIMDVFLSLDGYNWSIEVTDEPTPETAS